MIRYTLSFLSILTISIVSLYAEEPTSTPTTTTLDNVCKQFMALANQPNGKNLQTHIEEYIRARYSLLDAIPTNSEILKERINKYKKTKEPISQDPAGKNFVDNLEKILPQIDDENRITLENQLLILSKLLRCIKLGQHTSKETYIHIKQISKELGL